MAFPIAHSCFGLALGIWRLVPRSDSLHEVLRLSWDRRVELFVCILIANAPDIDIIFGFFTGNLNRFHQTGTHTLSWILVTAFFVWLYGKYALKNRPVLAFWFVFLLLAGHLVIDIFTSDTKRPIGIMLTWPFSDVYWHSKVSIFRAPVKKSLADIANLQNLKTVGWELLISLPVVFLVMLSKVHRRRGSG